MDHKITKKFKIVVNNMLINEECVTGSPSCALIYVISSMALIPTQKDRQLTNNMTHKHNRVLMRHTRCADVTIELIKVSATHAVSQSRKKKTKPASLTAGLKAQAGSDA